MYKKIGQLIGLGILSVTLLGGCAPKTQVESNAVQTEEQTEEQTVDSNSEKEQGEDGLVIEESLKLEYANNFAVDYCKGGYKIITDGDGRKILLVPEGKEVPQLEEEMTILQAPITEVGCFSTTHVTQFKALNALDKVTMVTTDKDRWYIDQIVSQMEEGKTAYVGKNKSPDYELISAAKPQLITVTSNTLHGSDEVLNKFDELGIPWIGVSEHLETHPLGRLEWVKLIGALLDQEEQAEDFFEAQKSKILGLEGENVKRTEHPHVLQTYIFKGTAYVRNSSDYVNKMIELAGGSNLFADLEPGKSGNTKMTVEEFYKTAVDTDILIYDNTSDVSVATISDILANGEYLADMKAIKEGNVWGIHKHYWQSADDVATMIKEISTIIYEPEKATDLQYFYKLER